jgi:hypothetical protein
VEWRIVVDKGFFRDLRDSMGLTSPGDESP